MKDLEIKISKETRKVDIFKSIIGNEGENLQANFVFSFTDEFVDGQARLEYTIDGISNYQIMQKQDETYVLPIKSVITKKGQIDMQLVITEGVTEEEIPIFKSNTFYVYCNRSINAEIEQPDEYLSWIEIANTKLNQFDEVIQLIETEGNGDKYLSDDGTYKYIETGIINYEELDNKPQINSVELIGNKTLEELGIQPKGDYLINEDLEEYATKEYVDKTLEDINPTLGEEKDPTVPSHVKGITEENINNWNNKSDFSGNYEDLNNLPELPDVSNFMTEQDVKDLLENKDCLKEKDIYVVNLPSENVTSIITDLSIAFGEANAKYQNDKKNKRYAYILNLNKDHVDILVLDCSILSGTATSITMVGQLLKNNDSSIIYKEYKFNYMKYSNTSFSVMSMTLTTSQNNYATEEYVDELVGDINTILSTLTTVSEVVE